ncbi:MAG: hypothetical protein ACO3JL_21915, partial [Myxococcota bacterium]
MELCFEGPTAEVLVAGVGAALAFVSDVRVDDGPSVGPPMTETGQLVLPSLPDDTCVTYRFDVDAALRRHDRELGYRIGSSVVLPHDIWLRPHRYDETASVRARIRVPDGFALSAPWADSGDPAYPLTWSRSTFRRRGEIAIGRFSVHSVPLT